jgi:hypothetical protein
MLLALGPLDVLGQLDDVLVALVPLGLELLAPGSVLLGGDLLEQLAVLDDETGTLRAQILRAHDRDVADQAEGAGRGREQEDLRNVLHCSRYCIGCNRRGQDGYRRECGEQRHFFHGSLSRKMSYRDASRAADGPAAFG